MHPCLISRTFRFENFFYVNYKNTIVVENLAKADQMAVLGITLDGTHRRGGFVQFVDSSLLDSALPTLCHS
jgi:hypothetical protein